MGLRNFYRFSEIMSLEECNCDYHAFIRSRRTALVVRVYSVILPGQYPWIELPAFIVLTYRPRPHFLGATLLIGFTQLFRLILSKEKNELFHGWIWCMRCV